MTRRTLPLIIALALLAIAAVPAAATAPRHPVTVTAARHALDRYDARSGVAAHVVGCAPRSPAMVICTVDLVGLSPVYEARYEVTRSGACTAGRVVRKTKHRTVVRGGEHYGNCFTGPLRVIPIQGSLRIL